MVSTTKVLLELRDLLPTWADGSPTFWIMYAKGPDEEILKGPMMKHDLEAYALAEWMVNAGLIHSAWVVADVCGTIRKREVAHVG